MGADNLELMAALIEAVNQDELIEYICRMLRKQGYFVSTKLVRRYVLDSFREFSPLDLFRFIRVIPNYAAQISHDFYHLLGANPRLLFALRGMGVRYRPAEINRFHREEQEARRRNQGHSRKKDIPERRIRKDHHPELYQSHFLTTVMSMASWAPEQYPQGIKAE